MSAVRPVLLEGLVLFPEPHHLPCQAQDHATRQLGRTEAVASRCAEEQNKSRGSWVEPLAKSFKAPQLFHNESCELCACCSSETANTPWHPSCVDL